MRSRKGIVEELDGFADEARKNSGMIDAEVGGEGADIAVSRIALGIIGKVATAQLEVALDIRDAVTTWIAGDLSARSTAQQYRNTATEAVVKLLRGLDKKLDVLVQRGKP